MTRLILTNCSSAAGNLKVAGRADIAIPIESRLVWGRLPSNEELAAFFAARTTQANGLHWQDYTPTWRLDRFAAKGLGLIEFCAKCETIELWIDPEPNAQLVLIWILDFFRQHEKIVSKADLGPSRFDHRKPFP